MNPFVHTCTTIIKLQSFFCWNILPPQDHPLYSIDLFEKYANMSHTKQTHTLEQKDWFSYQKQSEMETIPHNKNLETIKSNNYNSSSSYTTLTGRWHQSPQPTQPYKTLP